MPLFNRLILNATSIFAARVVEGLLQLAVLSFILSQVSKEYYGAALLIISIQRIIELGRGGMQKATLKYIAEYDAVGNNESSIAVLSSSSIMQGFVGVLGFLACLIISPYLSVIFSLPKYMLSEAQLATILLGLGIAVTFTISPWQNSVAARERYDLVSLAIVSGKILRALLIVVLLMSSAPILISLVLATIAGNVFERLSCILFIRKISPHFKFSIRYVSYRQIKTIFGFSFYDFFHTLSGLLYIQGSLYIATHLISLKAVAALGIIGNITSLTGIVMSQFAQMLVPVASRLEAQNEKEKIRNVIIHGTTVIVFAGGIVMVGLVPWLDQFLFVWLGHSFVEIAIPGTILISATFLVNSLTCIHNSLGGIGKVAIDGISNTICTILGLIIGIVLIYSAKFGLIGLATGLLCARFFRFIFLTYYGTRLFDLTFGKFLWTGYLRTYTLIVVCAIAGASSGISVNSWTQLIIISGATVVAYFLIGIFWIVDPVDRFRFLQAFLNGVEYLKDKFRKNGKHQITL